jgi:hypothetical protein
VSAEVAEQGTGGTDRLQPVWRSHESLSGGVPRFNGSITAIRPADRNGHRLPPLIPCRTPTPVCWTLHEPGPDGIGVHVSPFDLQLSPAEDRERDVLAVPCLRRRDEDQLRHHVAASGRRLRDDAESHRPVAFGRALRAPSVAHCVRASGTSPRVRPASLVPGLSGRSPLASSRLTLRTSPRRRPLRALRASPLLRAALAAVGGRERSLFARVHPAGSGRGRSLLARAHPPWKRERRVR